MGYVGAGCRAERAKRASTTVVYLTAMSLAATLLTGCAGFKGWSPEDVQRGSATTYGTGASVQKYQPAPACRMWSVQGGVALCLD